SHSCSRAGSVADFVSVRVGPCIEVYAAEVGDSISRTPEDMTDPLLHESQAETHRVNCPRLGADHQCPSVQFYCFTVPVSLDGFPPLGRYFRLRWLRTEIMTRS